MPKGVFMDGNTLILAAIIVNSALLCACLIGVRLIVLEHRLYQRFKKTINGSTVTPYPYRVQPGALVFGPFWAMANGLPWIAACYLFLLPLKLGFLLNLILFFAGDKLSWKGGQRWLYNRKKFDEENYIFNFLAICVLCAVGLVTVAEIQL